MLLITDPDVKQVLRVEDIIDDMERAFAEEARGVAVNRPRTRYKVPPDRDSDGYMANIIPGAVPSSGVAALRYDSMVVRERMVDGLKRMDYPYPARRSWGFVLLFSLETAEPLAIIHDFSLSSIRVGATTGVATARCPGRTATWWGCSARATKPSRTWPPSARCGTCARRACTASRASTGNGSPWK